MTTTTARTGTVPSNGAELYYEIRGDGPAVVCIGGGANDASVFENLADLLADTYTVVTYDRRGLSRSPRPDGWTATSIEEQADDCAGLIGALGLDRPVLFGHSLGGTIVVSLLERHPEVVRGAVVHEPGLSPIAPSAPAFVAEATQRISAAAERGEAASPLEILGRFILGDEAWQAMDPALLARISANADVNALEIAAEGEFKPNAAALAAVEVPVHAIYGEDTQHAWLVESARWVSDSSGGPLHVFPGGHGAWLGREQDFAQRLRPILASMSG